ncbi:MAG: amidohydrolase family protein, partial [Bacteroidales bacterium]|nr:amidohydrolase family protein [Bacteroidales bacterium]
KKHNLNICIGTDSLSSNHKLHIVSEMRCLQENFPELTLEELIRWASYNGACALGKESIFGSLESGKKPGIVLISNIEGESADDLRLTAASESTRLI